VGVRRRGARWGGGRSKATYVHSECILHKLLQAGDDVGQALPVDAEIVDGAIDALHHGIQTLLKVFFLQSGGEGRSGRGLARRQFNSAYLVVLELDSA
jgi:hypothetical protein